MKFWAAFLLLSHARGVIAPSPGFLASASSEVQRKAGCIKVNPCKCILADGSGVISLAALGDSQGYLERLTPLPPGDAHSTEALLSFNPCLPFSQPEDFSRTDCVRVAACVILRDRTFRHISRYIDYGRHEGNVFEYNSNTKTLTISYPGPSSSWTQARVHFQCSPNRSILASHRLGGDVPLEMWVDNPCVCPNACTLEDVGPGTIFLIILCLSATAYFVLGNITVLLWPHLLTFPVPTWSPNEECVSHLPTVPSPRPTPGSCALRPFRTRSGVQIAPEDWVWCSLCYLFAESRGRPSSRRHSSLKEETP